MILDAQQKGIPTFTIKGTDKYAVGAIRHYYALLLKDDKVSEHYKAEIRHFLLEFERYHIGGLTKIPD